MELLPFAEVSGATERCRWQQKCQQLVPSGVPQLAGFAQVHEQGDIVHEEQTRPPHNKAVNGTRASRSMEPFLVERLAAPFGARVWGIDLRTKPPDSVLDALEREAALRGFLVFPNQTLPGDELVRVSTYFGGGSVAAAHLVHEAAVHDDIFRVSNVDWHGVYGVGPQWHSDGAFERRVFSHLLFHAQQMPVSGDGGTEFTDLASAFASLSPRQQEDYSRLAIVNAYSGALQFGELLVPLPHV